MKETIENEKIFCANCKHCILIRQSIDGKPDKYYLRCMCVKNHWKTAGKPIKYYKYCNIHQKAVKECDDYYEMGYLKKFMKDLKKNLPEKDEIYKNDKKIKII